MKSIICTMCILVLATQAAFAKSDAKLSRAEMVSSANHIEFVFHFDRSLAPDALSARVDDTLIVLEIENTQVQRSWIASTHASVKRILLHPSRAQNAAALRIRYFQPRTKLILENIRVRAEGNRLIAAVPNSDVIARSWAEHAEAEAEAETVSPLSQGTKSSPNQLQATRDLDEEAIAIAPLPEEQVIDVSTVSDEKQNENNGLIENEAGIAATEHSNTPTLVVALLMMLGVAFVLFKKMRQMKPSNEGGPLIRPIGTHMLGPKQGLLLVDVAGERVLLGTTDKGVHLLTKLEGHGPEAFEQSLKTADHQTPATVNASDANPFGKMLGQFREASQRLRSPKSAGREASAKANGQSQVADLSLLAKENGPYDRRLSRPVTPRVPVPPYEAQTSIQERDALIEKLRMLKGA